MGLFIFVFRVSLDRVKLTWRNKTAPAGNSSVSATILKNKKGIPDFIDSKKTSLKHAKRREDVVVSYVIFLQSFVSPRTAFLFSLNCGYAF